MKNIFVATDFSASSRPAVLFGAWLARASGARLLLFNAFHPAVLLEEETIWAGQELLEQKVQEKIDQWAREIHTDFGISVTRVLKPGFAVDEMVTVSKKAGACLVLLGTEGAGRRPKERYGKVCTEMLQQHDIAIVAVPPQTPVKYPEAFRNYPDASCLPANKKGTEVLRYFLQAALKHSIQPITGS